MEAVEEVILAGYACGCHSRQSSENWWEGNEMLTSSFRDISIGIFFLTLSGSLVATYVKADQKIDHYLESRLEQAAARTQDFRALQASITKIVDTYVEGVTQDREKSAAIIDQAQRTAMFLEDISLFLAARAMEDEGMISPAKADEIARESIDNIARFKSKRVGELIEALNNHILRRRPH